MGDRFKYLNLYSLFFEVHWQAAGLEAEYSGLEMVLRFGMLIL